MASDHDYNAQSIDVEALAATLVQASLTVAIKTHRVGGVVNGVECVGGSNLPGEENDEPDDILCFISGNFGSLAMKVIV